MFILRRLLIRTLLLSAALILAVGPSLVQAQQLPNVTTLTPNVKEYGRPGYPVFTVYVWGEADTGVWSVEEGTDLLEFISVISRAQFGARGPDRRSIQKLKLYRDGKAEGKPFFEARIQDLFTARGSYPTLQSEDILVLETQVKGRFTWRDLGQMIGIASTILNTYLILDRIQNN
ncbi:MAG TPA: hypothetical protein VJ884_01235 [Salinibacter sp.]|nr:hypothetical protein [Salinibacter sp.]